MPSAVSQDQPVRYAPLKQDDALSSPLRPSVSPITPVPAFAQLAPQDAPTTRLPRVRIQPHQQPVVPWEEQPKFSHRPDSLAIDEDDNTDALALKAALNILQIQRDKTKRDLRTLRQLKYAASYNPRGFVEELVQGRLKHDRAPNDPLHATFESSDLLDDEDSDDDAREASEFPRIPTAQNVVRCPPINWAKYHVVGDSLEKMHEAERKKPTAGELQKEHFTERSEHFVTAPYDPFQDKAVPQEPQHPMQTRRGSTKQ